MVTKTLLYCPRNINRLFVEKYKMKMINLFTSNQMFELFVSIPYIQVMFIKRFEDYQPFNTKVFTG